MMFTEPMVYDIRERAPVLAPSYIENAPFAPATPVGAISLWKRIQFEKLARASATDAVINEIRRGYQAVESGGCAPPIYVGVKFREWMDQMGYEE